MNGLNQINLIKEVDDIIYQNVDEKTESVILSEMVFKISAIQTFFQYMYNIIE